MMLSPRGSKDATDDAIKVEALKKYYENIQAKSGILLLFLCCTHSHHHSMDWPSSFVRIKKIYQRVNRTSYVVTFGELEEVPRRKFQEEYVSSLREL